MTFADRNANERMRAGLIADAEATLRLVASQPVPEGLEERMKAALKNAPRTGRVLAWPGSGGTRGWMQSTLVRTAAAAAIVFVVAGGGWGVYSHVKPAETARVIEMPKRVAAPGQFSSAGAMRTPNGTVPAPTSDVSKDEKDKPAGKSLKAKKPSRAKPGAIKSLPKR